MYCVENVSNQYLVFFRLMGQAATYKIPNYPKLALPTMRNSLKLIYPYQIRRLYTSLRPKRKYQTPQQQ